MTQAQRRYDAIVVGVGGMGSAAAYHLARRGVNVLGLERFDIPNRMGSSHGLTRIIRLAYFEHVTYVPLLRRAYVLWRELQREVGEELLCITGSVDVGQAGSRTFEGSLASCRQHGLSHEVLSRAEFTLRFPAFRVPSGFQAVLQPEGGFLLSERCIATYAARALALGAELHGRERVLAWEPVGGDGVRVRTDRATYEAGRLVVCSGAWASGMVDGLATLAVPERQVVGWFHPPHPELFQPGSFPVFNLTVEEGHFYGFPIHGVPGFKVGRYHHLGEKVSADGMDRECHPRDEAVLREFVQRYLPEGAGPTMALQACMFTNTPDEHFIIDRLADHPQVIVAAGFSGHGFKFASVVGEILADLATGGETPHDISLFSLSRFA